MELSTDFAKLSTPLLRKDGRGVVSKPSDIHTQVKRGEGTNNNFWMFVDNFLT